MKIIWSEKAVRDVERLVGFVRPYSSISANKVRSMLVETSKKLIEYPRRGLQLKEFSPQEVRRIIVGNYELRYKLDDNKIIILDIWRGREDR